MSWNNGLERKKFEAEWRKTEEKYIAAGMTSDAIEEMRSFDWDLFKKRRIAAIHEQAMTSSRFDDDTDDDSQSALLEKFLDVMSINGKTIDNHSKDWWIEEIDNPELAKAILELSECDKEMILMICFEGFSLKEFALKKELPYRTAKYRLSVLKKKIKKYLF